MHAFSVVRTKSIEKRKPQNPRNPGYQHGDNRAGGGGAKGGGGKHATGPFEKGDLRRGIDVEHQVPRSRSGDTERSR